MQVSLTGYQQDIQERQNWCWAAMVTSLIRFHFQRVPSPAPPPMPFTPPLSQCQVVQAVLGPNLPWGTACCEGPGIVPWLDPINPPPDNSWADLWSAGSSCNSKAPTDPALQNYLRDHFGITYDYVRGALPQSEIERQLSEGWPVYIVRTDGDGGEHILAITGIDGDRLTIEDPLGEIKSATFKSMATPVPSPKLLIVGNNDTAKLYYIPNAPPLSKIEHQLSEGRPIHIIRTDGDGAEHPLTIVGIDGDRLTIEDSDGTINSATFTNPTAPSASSPKLRGVGTNDAVKLYFWVRTYFHI